MKNTKKAFLWITNILEKNNISYKIFGGMAAQIYGVKRELADIDIVVEDKNISIIESFVKPYIIFGPESYKDESFDLNLLTLNYEYQEIDIASNELKFFNKLSGMWELCSPSLSNISFVEVYGKKVPVENIYSLIDYKSKLQRDVDREDVTQLKLILESK